MKLSIPLSPENKLVRWANRMRSYYGHPVYLVGSQLTDKKTPTDVDVVCIIPNDEFELRFCEIGLWHQEGGTFMYTEEGRWKWSDRCVKDTLDGMRFTGLNIDFKVYPKAYDLAYPLDKFPKLKLDTRE